MLFNLFNVSVLAGWMTQANEFVHRNLPQNIGQYQSLNVISFDERLVYICQTDYKYFDKAFRRVENLFLKITKDLLI